MKNTFFIATLSILLSSCIGDDIILDTVDELLRITQQASSIAVGESFQFEARFTNNIGETEEGRVIWSSSDETILNIDANGLATGLQQGSASVIAEVPLANGDVLREEMPIEVSSVTTVVEMPSIRTGEIITTTFYTLEGDFTLEEQGDSLLLNIADNYRASSDLPGLYVYLTNNPNSINGAFEIGEVSVFEGAHSYQLSGVELNDFDYILYFCKPFRVKVGDGEIN